MFSLRDVSVKAGKKILLSNISLTFEEQGITAIIGANGAGKSSLLRCLLGEYTICRGQLAFDHKKLSEYSLCSLSRRRAYISQTKVSTFKMLVLDYLVLARCQYTETEKYSENLVLSIAAEFNLLHFLNRDITTLSGGERQLVEFARAYLQLYEGKTMEGKCLLLDEPASALDIKQTALLYVHLLHFQKQHGTVIIIEHDINRVANLASHIVMMKSGEIMAHGKADDVFTQDNLDRCFDAQGSLIKGKTRNCFYQLNASH